MRIEGWGLDPPARLGQSQSQCLAQVWESFLPRGVCMPWSLGATEETSVPMRFFRNQEVLTAIRPETPNSSSRMVIVLIMAYNGGCRLEDEF